ncbi:hypothetical protein BN903_194 [Halorubrum sp. AJ67]|nr:hypothetical protein BN903_194 [Halorubrum sp. AJ67]
MSFSSVDHDYRCAPFFWPRNRNDTAGRLKPPITLTSGVAWYHVAHYL